MKNVSHKKIWRTGAVKVRVEPPPIPLNKSKNNAKSFKDCVKFVFRRDPTSEKSDLYEFETALFGIGKPYVFLLFVRKFQIKLKALGALTDSEKLQCICTLLCGEALRHLDTLCVEVGSITTKHSNRIILYLGA